MPDNIWETLDTLFELVLEQRRKLRELEARYEALEQRLRAPHPALVIDKPISLELMEAQHGR